MTKESPPVGQAGAPEKEIEITPEMIEAGVIALESFCDSFSDVWLVQAIYNAMRPLELPAPGHSGS